MAIEIIIGVITGILCGVLQSVIMKRVIGQKHRWLFFAAKLAVYIVFFAGMLLYSQSALISCAAASLLVLWINTFIIYRKMSNSKE